MKGRSFLAMEDWTAAELELLFDLARRVKGGEVVGGLEKRVLAMVFLDPSMRTRTSFETAMYLHGGHAVVIEPGKGSWTLETETGVVMDGASVEHLIEASRVLSRYADAVAVRTFPKGRDWAREREDPIIRSFADYCDKPVINLESVRRHPCQGLADALTLREKLGEPRGKKFVLHWAWHPKPLPTAVPASAAIAAAHLGMDVVIARPEGYDLDPEDLLVIRRQAEQAGGSVHLTDDLDEALSEAHAVYPKSWGSLQYFGNPELESQARAGLRDWRLTAARMEKSHRGRGIAMHCLPVRRNVEIDDAVLDGVWSAVIDQAENRLHVQRALLLATIGDHPFKTDTTG